MVGGPQEARLALVGGGSLVARLGEGLNGAAEVRDIGEQRDRAAIRQGRVVGGENPSVGAYEMKIAEPVRGLRSHGTVFPADECTLALGLFEQDIER